MELEQEHAEMVGREPELAVLTAFLDAPSGDRTAIVTGSPGIGKTTLWQSAIRGASQRGARVLEARASEAEARYSLVALADLLEDVDELVLSDLPPPQRKAFEVALLRVEPGDDDVDLRALGAGLRSLLDLLSAKEPVLVAVDDVQWLDRESAAAIAFSRRRLGDRNVAFLFSQRAETSSELTRRASDSLRIELAPLSFGAIRHVLVARLGLQLGRRTVRRIHEATAGNPLFALEIGRALSESGLTGDGEDIPVPGDVEGVLGVRVGRLPLPQRTALLAVALGGELSTHQLATVVDRGTISAAERSGVLIVSEGRVRPAHPLYAEASRSRATETERCAVHRALSSVIGDEALALRHRAFATATPDDELAGTLSAASATAARRGAAVTAAELASHALRLTPPDDPHRHERLLTLCESLMVAGEADRATAILGSAIENLPRGPLRARAHLIVAEGRGSRLGLYDYRQHHAVALVESEADPLLHATAIGRMSRYLATGALERLADAEAIALDALPAAHEAGSVAEREVLYGLAWARVVRGEPVDDLRDRFAALSGDTHEIYRSLDRVVGERNAHRGVLELARATVERLTPLADERGEEWSLTFLQMASCELLLRAGQWNAAAAFLEDWDPAFETAEAFESVRIRYLALLAAGRGRSDEADLHAQVALADPDRQESRWHVFELARARGTAALAAGRPEDAAAHLLPVWEHVDREGVDPGIFPIAPDLVEALTSIGEIARADAVTESLAARAEALDHPWGRAAAKRCRGIVAFARHEGEGGAALELLGAAKDFHELGLRFDHARSLLALGRGERRRRRWASARQVLEEAASAFDAQGAPGWAAVARAELARVGGRKPAADGALTPSERRAVELAIEGLSNKGIAATMVVSVHTVEVHLSHAYAKLGVRSRSQLAGAIAVTK